jgi:hypothetical protein
MHQQRQATTGGMESLIARKGKMTPEQLAKCGSEHANQVALFCWAAMPETRALYPGIELMFAIPNGGERNIKVAAQLKAEGVKAGVLDIFLPFPIAEWHGLFIEMKVEPNKPTIAQCAFATSVFNLGFRVELCYSWEQARDKIVEYYNYRERKR